MTGGGRKGNGELGGAADQAGPCEQALLGDRAGTGSILWSLRQVMMRTTMATTSSTSYALGITLSAFTS